ncbi:ATP-binding cassette, subfamily C [Micromonospora pattaloongensis]|uniref:ATP-binding cassette, subfamily C n=1 Tax=Micromonospora pattaloongensis TaxID=405436 RepID=A0A1H3NSL3_9ACTN|nr:ABC transporter ATP-binding protein [Micromonospora pattaloongensis]SDY91911.1 ATP-binding cassette, subfamily C [Micromonospora pattaloongensis]
MTAAAVRGAALAALRARPRAVLRLAAWSAAEALPALLTGYATARAVDDGFLAGRPGTGLAWLAWLAVAVVVGAVGSGRAFACLGQIVEPFRDDLARRVVDAALHRATGAGGRPDTSAVARLTHQIEIVRDTLGGLVMAVRGFLFAAAAALLGLVSLAPLVAAIVAGPLLVALALFGAALPAMVQRQREYVRADERLGESASAALAGQRDVVACGAQDAVAGEVGAQITAQEAAERALARMAALRSLILAVGGWLPIGVLLLAAPWLVRRGLSAGAILGALVYVSTGLQPALHTLVQGVAGGGLRFAVTLDRILATARRRPRPYAPRSAAVPRRAPVAVELRDVTFRYGPAARPVLDGFDLVLPDGDHLAVVGPSGAGKSTLAALTAGLLRPQAGTVRLTGVPVAGLEQSTLAALRVLVPQEAYVFTGTLGDNLRYLRGDVDEAELAAAVDALGLRPLVRRFGGLSAPVDPAALSAGERQLIAAVRAYLSPARLAILDEATCHLDAATEARVEAAFAARPGTLIVIAHRISSALRARRVLIVDGSRPVLGTHAELLARSAAYRELLGHWQERPAGHSGTSLTSA